MPDAFSLKAQLTAALLAVLAELDAADAEIVIQEVPEGKPGDYGTPLAFALARRLRQNPSAIAQQLVARLALPPGIVRAEAVGPYINVHVERASFVEAIATTRPAVAPQGQKVIVEHTSVNPNKEAHVGHLRNIALGDACARILRAAGFEIEVHNYIDDTGRQAAESLFAVEYFGARFDGSKYDHWIGDLYERLQQAKETDGERIEAGVTAVLHRLERGELRAEVERVLRAQLTTCYALGVEYDLLVWESDLVSSGFLRQGLELMERSPYVSRPREGKYAGALVVDISSFIPGLGEPSVVLVRSDGSAMYVAKDIGYQFWKAGLFEGLTFSRFDTQPSGKALYSSSAGGDICPDGKAFAHGDKIINVIDVRQSHPQTIVRTALALSNTPEGRRAYDGSHHLAYEVVTLEGQPMSGRKGITLAIDTVLDEATRRAKAVVMEKNPTLEHSDEIARQVGIGALRFAMLKNEARKIIDFRWEQALSLQGDSAPYLQYAHARACSILRAAAAEGLSETGSDFSLVGELETKLAQVVARLPEVIATAARELAPHQIAQYGLELATAWNSYYNHKDRYGRPDTQVLRAAPGLREARLALVRCVKEALAEALALLGIGAPEEM